MSDSTSSSGVPAAFDAFARRLEDAFDAWTKLPRAWPDPVFEAYALEAFRLQFDANRPYARYCHAIGADPGSVTDWRAIPPVPTAAFRCVELIVGDPADAELRFRTSGTTRGAAERGTHLVRDAELYRAALLGPFRHAVLDSRAEARLLVLHAPFEPARDSSLAWMLDAAWDAFAAPGSTRVDPGGLGAGAAGAPGDAGASGGGTWDALDAAREADEPIAIIGTTLALAAWSDRIVETEGRIGLPAGSSIMDTGGVKGREGLDRGVVVAGLAETFGIPEDRVVNEFGMTELLSQRYATGVGRLAHRGPPWLRSRVLDPVTLEERPEGAEGILCHYDLANAGSAVAVLTEDRGRAIGDAIEWLGRTPGAVPRGCSIATADLLEAQE
ncbi:MAG: hypothetical protein ACR2GQ_11630 [Gemmatimonadota bacterium]